jgi:hypothetical protein
VYPRSCAEAADGAAVPEEVWATVNCVKVRSST